MSVRYCYESVTHRSCSQKQNQKTRRILGHVYSGKPILDGFPKKSVSDGFRKHRSSGIDERSEAPDKIELNAAGFLKIFFYS